MRTKIAIRSRAARLQVRLNQAESEPQSSNSAIVVEYPHNHVVVWSTAIDSVPKGGLLAEVSLLEEGAAVSAVFIADFEGEKETSSFRMWAIGICSLFICVCLGTLI
eukprot:SAG11_NODE_23724_length_384_cov_0.561404_1_plen_106_part_10